MKQQHTMTIHRDKPIGVDIFFREIFAGDTVRDQDGKEYTIDERGWARPMDGSTGCGFNKLKDPIFVKASDKPEAPAKFQEKDGKVGPVVPVDVPKPAPAPEYREGPAPHKGGRVNKSGFSQLGNLSARLGLTVTEARKICEDAGIEVVSYGKNHKAHVKVEDLPRVRELLTEASARPSGSKMPHLQNVPGFEGVLIHPGNNGNHRPNTTGYASFANLARGLHAKAWELRDFAKAHDFAIVRPTDKAHRNDGIYKEDEVRFRELWAVEHGSPAPAPVSAPEDDLHRPILGTTDIKKVWTKFDAFLILEDKDLADELRRRGYEVIAIKHVEL